MRIGGSCSIRTPKFVDKSTFMGLLFPIKLGCIHIVASKQLFADVVIESNAEMNTRIKLKVKKGLGFHRSVISIYEMIPTDVHAILCSSLPQNRAPMLI